MPSVADELAALRAGGGVKARAAGLENGAGLSTPEAEEAALKAKREQDKLGKANAREILSKGGSGASSQELEHSLQQKAKKKAEQDKINEAKKSLSKGGSSYVAAPDAAVPQPQAPKEKETTTNDNAAAPSVPAAVTEVEDVDDDDVPELEEADDIPTLDGSGVDKIQPTTGDAGSESRQVTNRNEKKARKMMQRLGMSPVSGIERATFKTGGQGEYFFINNPDVFTLGKTYVIFGEARQGGNMQQQQAAMAQAQAQAAMAQQQAGGGMPSLAEEGVEVEELPDIAEESVDESGVDNKDIDLVMSQAGCSRSKAVKALKENDNDLVNAIMSLTT